MAHRTHILPDGRTVVLVPRAQLRHYRGKPAVPTGPLPTPPAGPIDWTRGDTTDVPILGNNRVGNCYYCALCHWVQLVMAVRGTPVTFDEAKVVARYLVLSGGDNGLSDSDVFPEFKGGIVGPNGPYRAWDTLIVDPRNLALVKVMLWRFGPLLYTASLADAWLDNARPGATWDRATPNPMNGHAMVWGRQNADGTWADETWGFNPPVRLTPAGMQSCDPEVIAVLSPLWYDAKGYSPSGFHYTEDAALWVQLGGSAPPSTFPPPAGPPDPPPQPPTPGAPVLKTIGLSLAFDGWTNGQAVGSIAQVRGTAKVTGIGDAPPPRPALKPNWFAFGMDLLALYAAYRAGDLATAIKLAEKVLVDLGVPDPTPND